mmetsp:Transcript_38894/g.110288  ORF Transcript_38894/g.110288 Transcript_38894/m.110288 type:complete len:253 (+) Transcript_38894:311-1069(+)
MDLHVPIGPTVEHLGHVIVHGSAGDSGSALAPSHAARCVAAAVDRREPWGLAACACPEASASLLEGPREGVRLQHLADAEVDGRAPLAEGKRDGGADVEVEAHQLGDDPVAPPEGRAGAMRHVAPLQVGEVPREVVRAPGRAQLLEDGVPGLRHTHEVVDRGAGAASTPADFEGRRGASARPPLHRVALEIGGGSAGADRERRQGEPRAGPEPPACAGRGTSCELHDLHRPVWRAKRCDATVLHHRWWRQPG